MKTKQSLLNQFFYVCMYLDDSVEEGLLNLYLFLPKDQLSI
jgi:hypothetical protein